MTMAVKNICKMHVFIVLVSELFVMLIYLHLILVAKYLCNFYEVPEYCHIFVEYLK